MIRPEIDTIVDFGGGAGEFCEFIRDKVGRPIKFVIIDNNQDFKAQAEAKGFTVFESLDQLMSWEQFNPNTSLLNMSSVIHEIYSYADDFYDDVGYFWSQVGKCRFRQVAIRDMSMNENSYRTAPTDAILWVYENVFRNGGLTVKGVPLSEIMQSFENVWGEICDLKTRRVDVKNLVHFLIKYRYVENWEREVEENYLPVSQDKLANILTSAGYKFSHKESSKLDFYAKTWDKDFKLRIPDNDGYREIFSRWLKTLSTHIKWMLEHS